MIRLTVGEKKEILDFQIRNPEKSYRKMADYFSIKFGKKVNRYTCIWKFKRWGRLVIVG